LLPLVSAVALLALAGCTEPPRGELRWVRDDHHRIADPGALGAMATGTGCAPTRGEALTKAEQVAQFNLRSLAGPGRYRVRYELLDDGLRAEGHCIELAARAVTAAPHER
jgi:hypothetical protein